ncbi:hypothetical protein HXY33_01685 [Candidatus Bathyarchaeota archaeon]|nr:hypothetical protein [Candidatus Bathyarchaeota archaeon]
MPKTCLRWSEIVELTDLLAQVFSAISDMHNENPLAKCIQFPKIPSILSESLCILEREKLFPGCSNANFGGRTCDIIVRFPDGTEKTAEVKATGQSAFQRLSGKDIASDFLVWVHFGRFFEDQNQEIRAYVMENPNRIFPQGKPISLKEFGNADPAIRAVVLCQDA